MANAWDKSYQPDGDTDYLRPIRCQSGNCLTLIQKNKMKKQNKQKTESAFMKDGQPALNFLLSQTNGELKKKQHGESSAEQALESASKAQKRESLGCLENTEPRGAGPGRRERLQHGDSLCNAGLWQHLP